MLEVKLNAITESNVIENLRTKRYGEPSVISSEKCALGRTLED